MKYKQCTHESALMGFHLHMNTLPKISTMSPFREPIKSAYEELNSLFQGLSNTLCTLSTLPTLMSDKLLTHESARMGFLDSWTYCHLYQAILIQELINNAYQKWNSLFQILGNTTPTQSTLPTFIQLKIITHESAMMGLFDTWTHCPHYESCPQSQNSSRNAFRDSNSYFKGSWTHGPLNQPFPHS